MKHEPTPLAPSAARSRAEPRPDNTLNSMPAAPAAEATSQQAETPAQKAVFTRRVRRAAREAEAEAARFEAEKPPVPEIPPEPSQIDAHGFDPSEYKWLPVRRKPRKDGWTPQRQRDFIAALAQSGSIEFACMQVDMSKSSAHRLRRSPGGEQFSAAWDVALQHAARVLLDAAFERAFNGSTEPVFDRDGNRTGTRYRQNDRLMMFLLRAYLPDRFRHAHRDWRSPDEALPPSPVPMEEVLRKLEPVAPAEPHRLMDPEELEDALFVADNMPAGELPRWHRGTGEAEPNPPIDEEFEAKLERLKRGEKAYRPESG